MSDEKINQRVSSLATKEEDKMLNRIRQLTVKYVYLMVLELCLPIFVSGHIGRSRHIDEINKSTVIQGHGTRSFTNNSYILSTSCINMGGTRALSSDCNSINSIGQSTIGRSSNSNYIAHIGFLSFLVRPLESITVTSPNGGEIWGVGEDTTIIWTWGNSIDSVRIEYSTDEGGSWVHISDTVNAGFHPWIIPNTPSTRCRVKVSDLTDGVPWDMSDSNFAIAVNCSISDTIAPPTSEMAVPIIVKNDVTGLEVWSYLTTIAFSPSVLIADSVYNGEIIPLGWGPPTYNITDGLVEIVGAGTYSPLSDSGSLVCIVFHVVGSPGDTTTLHFQNFVFNEGIPPAKTRDGFFAVQEYYSISGNVMEPDSTPIDSVMIVLSDDIPDTTYTDSTGYYRFVDLVSDTYRVTPTKFGWTFDPSYREYIPLDSNMTHQNYTGTPIPVVPVWISDASASPGDTVFVPVMVGDVTGLEVYSCRMTLTFADTVIHAIGTTTDGTIAEPWGPPTWDTTTGRIDIAMAGVSPLAGSGPLVHVWFHVVGTPCDSTTIRFLDFLYNEGIPDDSTHDGLFIVLPDTPRLLSPYDGAYINDNTPTLIWSSTTGPDGTYKLECALDSSFTQLVDIASGLVDTFYTTTPLPEDTCYWHVQALCFGQGIGYQTHPFSFCVDTTGPMFSETTIWPDTGFPGPYPVSSIITDALSGVDSAFLYYRFESDTTWNVTLMHLIDENRYQDTIESVPTPRCSVYYYLTAKDSALNTGFDPAGAPENVYSFVLVGISEQEATTPAIFSLSQNQPNPCHSETKIVYQLPEPEKVTLEIYNGAGQLVNRLVDEIQQAGHHEVPWNLTDCCYRKVAAGIYFYRLRMRKFSAVKKIIVLR